MKEKKTSNAQPNNENNFNNSKNVEKNLLAKYFRGFYLLLCFVLQSVRMSWLSVGEANKSLSMRYAFYGFVNLLHFLDYSNALN